MKVIMVRYKVKSDAVAENEKALKKVFVAIEEDSPRGVRYTSCKQADGVSFVAMVQLDDGAVPLTEKEYFKEFQVGLMSRLDGQPVQEELQVVGAYNFFSKSKVRLTILWDNEPTDINSFERHYREVHIPLAKQLPGLRRYTLSRNMILRRGSKPYYLVAELDWENIEALQDAFASPAGQAVSQDVSNLEKFSPGVRSMVYELEDV